MNDSEKSRARFPQWERYAWVLAMVWTVVVAASLVWNVVRVRYNTLEAARIQARVAHGKDVIYRRWNAGHGGVYVPVTDETPPNPYLSHMPERDITTPSGKLLTLMNPAYMTRQVHELAEEEYGVRGHITSLNPIRPENAPDPWETEALQAFERGETEFSSVEEMEGEEYMRLMRPLITEKGCLKCHAAQGYQEGDIRGGISVSIPVEPLWAVARMQVLTLAGGHAMLWLMGLGGIVLGTQRLRRSEWERKRAEEELLQRELRLSVLNRMGRALAGTFELARIYRIAYEHVAQLVDCPGFGISLYDPTTRTLRAEFMLDDGELIDAARFPPLVMGMEPTQGRVRAIITRQPEIITDYPAALEKATDPSVRVGVSEDEHVTGAATYLPMVARDQVIGLLEVQSYRLNAYGVEHAALLGPVANQIGLSIQNAQLYEEAQQQLAERKRAEGGLQRTLAKLREALGGIIQTVALTVETKDPYTAGHQRRVGNLARAIANEMDLSEEQVDGIRMAGLIHDLGKIAIPSEILSTPNRLNDLQWGMIRTHPQGGYDILKTVEFPWPVAQIVLQHHERLDGSGYPAGLSGDEIMLEARILAVADVVEAVASFRPYRPARGIDKALEEVSQNRDILYDPEVVDACLKLFTEKGFELK